MLKMDLKESLKNKLSKKELDSLQKSFDVIGSIAVIDIPSQLKKKEKLIAQTLMASHSNIKTVLKKEGRIKGRLRTRKLKFIAGEKTKEAIHKESGCIFKLNVETCYFSPRMSNDRLEIARQVKLGEKILVMFGGVAPYAIVIAKNSRAKKIYSVEINKTASKYAAENVGLNKLDNVEIIQGDVKRIIPKLRKKGVRFDRIVMARAQLKDDFLKEALSVAREGCIIHFHDFLFEENIPEEALAKISKAVEKISKQGGVRIESYKVIRWKKAGDIGPRKYRIRVDFFVF
jgi:tRNA (guanine37-N1)-methyltransferase